jgi:hypothetical protein
MTPTGCEHAQQYSTFCDSEKSYALTCAFSPELQVLIDAWPELPAATRRRIVALATQPVTRRAK